MTTFSNRHDVEQQLAALPATGCIVEVGVGYGNGLIALSKGNVNHLPIYGVDPYYNYTDPLGGAYGEATRQQMYENTEGIKWTHVDHPALDVAATWDKPIGLLWIDLSMPYDKLKPVFDAWQQFVMPGGYVGITGLCYPNQLGTRDVLASATITGKFKQLWPEQDFVAVMQKSVDVAKSRAVFYIANGSRYEDEALISAKSVKRWLDNIPAVLFAVHETDGIGFDRVINLPPPTFDGWYRNQVKYFNQAVNTLADVDQLLYLDTDTFVCRDCRGIWQILDHYEMALGHAAGRGATPTAVNCPSEFATLGIGVEFFNNTPKLRRFFTDWQAQFEREYQTYGETDEGPFRDLLFLNNHDVRYFVLAPEEHCRFGFGVWLNGAASILHGRVDTPLAEIAEAINRETSMRLYRYNGKGIEGLFWYHKVP